MRDLKEKKLSKFFLVEIHFLEIKRDWLSLDILFVLFPNLLEEWVAKALFEGDSKIGVEH